MCIFKEWTTLWTALHWIWPNILESKISGCRQWAFTSKKPKSNITHVQIDVQGSHLTGYRDLFDHSFYSTGDAIEGKTGFLSKYGLEIRENVIVEDDQRKQWLDYPTCAQWSLRILATVTTNTCWILVPRRVSYPFGSLTILNKLPHITRTDTRTNVYSTEHEDNRCALSAFFLPNTNFQIHTYIYMYIYN